MISFRTDGRLSGTMPITITGEMTATRRKLCATLEVRADSGEAKRNKDQRDVVENPSNSNVCDPDEQALQTSPPNSPTNAASTEIFITHGDAMLGLFEGPNGEEDTVWRKAAVHEAWATITANTTRGDDGPQRACRSSSRNVEYIACWKFNLADDENSSVRAQKLVQSWKDGRQIEKEGQWWYELLMQRSEPQGEDEPALKLVLEYDAGEKADGRACEGTWWMTGFLPADETHPALKHFHADMLEYY
ncbi:unnamed protein product [Peniophora sp. CBMAI 1063]|nr:unnamed protein product [Peniophora sp. CBMAI 1063]